MSMPTWCRVGASVVGTSHELDGGICQDAGLSIERWGAEGPILISVVSDGAGSAARGREGSRSAVRIVSRAAANYVRDGRPISELDAETINTWLDDVRDAISAQASTHNVSLRDYAATLIVAIVSESCAVIAHVGDGACVLGSEEGYRVPSWPAHGEYASTTFFITDEQVRLHYVREIGAFDRVALFSDGLELLVLQVSTQTAFAPFFDGVFEALKNSAAGKDRLRSRSLGQFLKSDRINQRTDDDKTLLLAYRVPKIK
jgi:Protein phosphatase 2C